MPLPDVVLITGLPAEEATRRIRALEQRGYQGEEAKWFIATYLAEGAGERYDTEQILRARHQANQAKSAPPTADPLSAPATPAPVSPETKPPSAKPVRLPTFPEVTRPAANPLSRSALFAAIQGKDREMLKDCLIASADGWRILFSGEQLNQDDYDTLMQLIFMAKDTPVGEYVTASSHAMLKAMGRDTGGKAHQTLKEEIKRLVSGTLEIENKKYGYMGHLVDDAVQDDVSKNWSYRINPRFSELFNFTHYTLVDLEQRKKLKRKDLARWLQLELASHAAPFARSVEYYREKSGSRASDLFGFRRALRRALDDLKENGDITSWTIDDHDLVHIERTPSSTQNRHIAKKITPPKK
jgi:hypothetical protein